MMFIIYAIVLFITSLYSFTLIDPNLTLINSPYWQPVQEFLVNIGYHNRQFSWNLYFVLLVCLFIFYFYFKKNWKQYKPLHIAIIVGISTFISYPFLSHDYFNYIFDAKILTYYGENPYTTIPADFSEDHWLRFMHWTHRTYPYGPVFLLLSLIPSFISFGYFILNFIFFRFFTLFYYVIGVYFLKKIDKRVAIEFAVHPLIIIEGIMNAHNDLIAVSLGFIGIYFLYQKNRSMAGRFFLILSAGIKYITVPILAFRPERKRVNFFLFLSQIAVLVYLATLKEIQPWYFISLFLYLPLYPQIIRLLNLFLFGLLVSYYPYVRLGDWNTEGNVELKHAIINMFFIINLVYLLYLFIKKIRNNNFSLHEALFLKVRT